jgi:hypothetical protein
MDTQTDEIIKRFKESWTETESFYDDLIKNHPGFEHLRRLRQFISDLSDKGTFNYFRLGTSVHSLITSRSVAHGLRSDQKHIKIEALSTDDFDVSLRDGDKLYRQFRIKHFEDVRLTKPLKTLKETLVD